MTKFAQQHGAEDAWRWVETQQTKFDPNLWRDMSYRFFQTWNGTDERGVVTDLAPEVPIRCTVWHMRTMFHNRLFTELVKQFLPSAMRAFKEILPSLIEKAKEDPQLRSRLESVKEFLGEGERYPQDIAEKAKYKVKEKVLEKRVRERQWREEQQAWETHRELGDPGPKPKRPPQRETGAVGVKTIWNNLRAFPELQKEFIQFVSQDAYTNFQKESAGQILRGFYQGARKSGGQYYPRRLLTFFLMQDPYPYIESIIVKPDGSRYEGAAKEKLQALVEDYAGKTSEENPARAAAKEGGKKTFKEWERKKSPGGLVVYQNAPNPDYDFVRLNVDQLNNPEQIKKHVRDLVQKLKTQAMFTSPFYLAKNVADKAQGLKDQNENPVAGIELYMLGQEERGIVIPPEQRDFTKLKDGGLFHIPEGGLPRPIESPEEKREKRKRGRPRKDRLVDEHGRLIIPPPTASLIDGLREVFGQEIVDESEAGFWIDDQGEVFDTMDQLLDNRELELTKQLIEELPNMMPQLITDYFNDLPSEGAVEQPTYEEPEYEQEPAYEFYRHTQEPQYQEEEQPLPMAARHVMRLVRVAQSLDNKGFINEAIFIDDLVSEIIDNDVVSS